MSAPALRIALVRKSTVSVHSRLQVLYLDMKTDLSPVPNASSAPLHLLILDVRGMSPACLESAFAETTRLHREPGFKRGALISETPRLPLVIGAIRAGLTDILQKPVTARHLYRLLRGAEPHNKTCAQQFSMLAALLRTTATAPASQETTALVNREYELLELAERLANTETRLNLQRESLEERENRWRTSIRRLESDFAAQQKDADLPAPAAPAQVIAPNNVHPLAAELEALAAQLEQRAHQLDMRERLLLEMENLLVSSTEMRLASGF